MIFKFFTRETFNKAIGIIRQLTNDEVVDIHDYDVGYSDMVIRFFTYKSRDNTKEELMFANIFDTPPRITL